MFILELLLIEIKNNLFIVEFFYISIKNAIIGYKLLKLNNLYNPCVFFKIKQTYL